VAARALREDFEDEQGAVVDRAVEVPLEVALLAGAERLVEQDLARAELFGKRLDLIGLAAAMNSLASGALRLQVLRATGSSPAVSASSPSSSSSESKWGKPRSTPTRIAGADGRSGVAELNGQTG